MNLEIAAWANFIVANIWIAQKDVNGSLMFLGLSGWFMLLKVIEKCWKST